MSNFQRVNMFLAEIINLTSNYKELEELNRELIDMKKNLNKPLRVAVVGVMKAGKSTLMNAIMGEQLVITNELEATYAPTWFRYGATNGIKIVLKDGKTIDASMEDIKYWTVRGNDNPQIDDVEYVVIERKNPILKEMELIDTPGLKSSYEKDSDNTLNFIGVNKSGDDKLDNITLKEASKADAVIYAFSRSMGEDDEKLLKGFGGDLLSNATPINAIGVLTKVDDYWCAGYANPLDGGDKIASNLRNNNRVRSVLYNIKPVIGRLGECRNYLDERDMELLRSLSNIDLARIKKLVLNSERFCEKEYEDIPVPPKERDYLWKKFGQYGIYTSIELLQKGLSDEEFKNELYKKSGVDELFNIVKRHFGNRSFLIKLQNIMSKIKTTCYKVKNGEGKSNPGLYTALECILSNCEKLEIEEHAFSELRVLQNYYNGILKLFDKEEEEDFLRITGEYGNNCEARLGMNDGTSIRDLTKVTKEKVREWNSKVNDIMNTQEYEDGARVIARSCEILYSHLIYLLGEK